MAKELTPREYTLALHLIPGMGPVRIQRLLEFFGTPELILRAPLSQLQQVQGIGVELAQIIHDWEQHTEAEKEMERAHQACVDIITIFDEDYPSSLRTIYDPPLVLYRKGTWDVHHEQNIAIIGSRQASLYGLQCAKRFSAALAEAGVSIISGLARGIDTAAHEGCLSVHGKTLAIIGSGLNQLYPQENKALSEKIIAEGGAIISEFPMNCPPNKVNFPLRNRLVSGWSQGVLVIEAPTRSGSLITANLATDQGRRVYAIPGSIDRPQSEGCHHLIRQGATLVTHPRDILEEFEWLPLNDDLTPSLFSPTFFAPKKFIPLDSVEQQICKAIIEGHDTIDALYQSTNLPVSDITKTLTRLQIKKALEPLLGGRFRVL